MRRIYAVAFAAALGLYGCSTSQPISQDARTKIVQTLYDADSAYTGTIQVAMVTYLHEWPRCKEPRTPGVVRCHDRRAEVPLDNANKAAGVAFNAAWDSICGARPAAGAAPTCAGGDQTVPLTTLDLLVTTAKNTAAAIVQVMQLYSVPLAPAK